MRGSLDTRRVSVDLAQMTELYNHCRNYVALTKPKILLLLLLTALGGMFLASKGAPEWTLVLVVLGGGALGSGGANALNHYMDRDIDERMVRTRKRPVPRGAIRPLHALVFGVVLNVCAFALLYTYANLLSALLTLGGDALLCLGLHRSPQAHHTAEHRHRRRGGINSAFGGLGGCDRHTCAAGILPLRRNLPVDAAALLGAGAHATR